MKKKIPINRYVSAGISVSGLGEIWRGTGSNASKFFKEWVDIMAGEIEETT